MSFQFSKLQAALLVLTLLLLAVALVYVHFGVLEPLRQEKEAAESELQLYQKSAARQNNAPSGTVPGSGRDLLLKRLPVQPQVDQYVLDLEKAETISGVTLLSAALQEGSTANTTTTAVPQATEQQNTAAASVPAAVPLRWAMEVRYDVYEQLESFLSELEKLPRLSVITSVTLQGRAELTSVVKRQPYTCSVLVTSYYLPNVKNADQLTPRLALPPLCKERTNPLQPQRCK